MYCGDDFNVSDDEVVLYFEKQILPVKLAKLKFKRGSWTGSVQLQRSIVVVIGRTCCFFWVPAKSPCLK